MYRTLIRPLLFLFPSETAHRIAMGTLNIVVALPFGKWLVRSLFGVRAKGMQREIAGLTFPNPLGIAAGFDKNGTSINALAALGFGHIEIGSVTPRPQLGNPRPRLFRLKKSRALINRMGFNNEGCIAIAHRLAKHRDRNFILGANIGKNKDTPNERAADDYVLCFDTLHPYVDYFVVNVSSPNTPGLRALQEREPLRNILEAVIARNQELSPARPLFLKIAPDLSDALVTDIVQLALELKLSGLIVANTTVSREGLLEDPVAVNNIGAGGVSGVPLRVRAQALLMLVKTLVPDDFLLIGVGGIDSPETAIDRIHGGASLIQLYTGFVYEGPGLVRRILKRLAE